jgi:hypothetical protein
MLLNVYLIGWLVTAIGVVGALVAANRLSDRRRSHLLSDGSLAVLAGALWPVLVVGVVEMLAIKAVVETMRAASAPLSHQALIEWDDGLSRRWRRAESCVEDFSTRHTQLCSASSCRQHPGTWIAHPPRRRAARTGHALRPR